MTTDHVVRPVAPSSGTIGDEERVALEAKGEYVATLEARDEQHAPRPPMVWDRERLARVIAVAVCPETEEDYGDVADAAIAEVERQLAAHNEPKELPDPPPRRGNPLAW